MDVFLNYGKSSFEKGNLIFCFKFKIYFIVEIKYMNII